MIPENHIVDVVIKKDFFVKSRKDNIKDLFDFINVNPFLTSGLGQRRIWHCLQSPNQRVPSHRQGHQGYQEEKRKEPAGPN